MRSRKMEYMAWLVFEVSKNWAEADAESWWAAVARACKSVVARVGAERIDAVGVVGQAPTATMCSRYLSLWWRRPRPAPSLSTP